MMSTFLDVVPSDAAIECSDFDSTEYINSLFPNKQSLDDADIVMAKIKGKVQRYDEDIQGEVRRLMMIKPKVNIDLKNAHSTVSNIFNKIEEIKLKAAESEMLANIICKDIIVLDRAKNNLASGITTIRRVKMVLDAMNQLTQKAEERKYRSVANLFGAIELILFGFSSYKDIPCVQELYKTMERVKDDLADRVEDEFNFFEVSNMENKDIDAQQVHILHDLCFVVDALGDTSRVKFINWFIKEQLYDYRQSFRHDVTASQLINVERRYIWLQSEFQYLQQTYPLIK